MSIITFTDNSIMPFGLHKGSKLIDVPTSYLIFLSEQKGWDKTTPLGRYIEDNKEALKMQARNDKQLRR